MTPNWKPDAAPTYHRDGSVSYWDVFLQQWARRPAHDLSDEVQASQGDVFRRRVGNMTVRYHRECADRCVPAPYIEDVDGCLVTRGEDPATGNQYAFLYRRDPRSQGGGAAELWRAAPDPETYIFRAVYTPPLMAEHTLAAIEARQQVAS